MLYLSRIFCAASLLCALLMVGACGGPNETVVISTVTDLETGTPLDSARVYLLAGREKGPLSRKDSCITDAEGQCTLSFLAEEGWQYRAETERRHYERALDSSGLSYTNQATLAPGDTNRLALTLALIPPPDPERFSRMHAEVPIPQLLASLRTDDWTWTFLPQINWTDVPALLEAGADTSFTHSYPTHPQSSYRPDSTRVGLVALWLIEALRQQQLRSRESANLMPPSRAPFLGTRLGNPRGYNSPEQQSRALEGYRSWYEATKVEGELLPSPKALRKNPLTGLGLSWM
jgi:hypothetical protein